MSEQNPPVGHVGMLFLRRFELACDFVFKMLVVNAFEAFERKRETKVLDGEYRDHSQEVGKNIIPWEAMASNRCNEALLKVCNKPSNPVGTYENLRKSDHVLLDGCDEDSRIISVHRGSEPRAPARQLVKSPHSHTMFKNMVERSMVS